MCQLPNEFALLIFQKNRLGADPHWGSGRNGVLVPRQV